MQVVSIDYQQHNAKTNQTYTHMDRNSTLLYIPISISSNDQACESKDQSEKVPSDAVIKNILNFSKALKVVKINSSGTTSDMKSAEVILN